MTESSSQPPLTPIQRQISLPMSKAIEIAYKSIRLRLSRSLVVTSGIVLALAFLISILANDALVRGMREWIKSAEASAAKIDAQKLEASMKSKGVPMTEQEIAN